MYKAFKLKLVGYGGSYGAYFVKCKLAGKDDALCSELIPSEAGGGADGVCLCGYMDLHIREQLADEEEDADVGNYHSIDRNIRKLGEIIAKGGILVLPWHSVERKVDLDAALVSVDYRLAELIHRKVVGGGAHTEA